MPNIYNKHNNNNKKNLDYFLCSVKVVSYEYESFSDNSTDKQIKESSLKHCGGHQR